MHNFQDTHAQQILKVSFKPELFGEGGGGEVSGQTSEADLVLYAPLAGY